MATTLMIAIEWCHNKIEDYSKEPQTYKDEILMLFAVRIYLQSLLPDEETIIRVAWKAALDWDTEVHTYPEKVVSPDLERYIYNLKK